MLVARVTHYPATVAVEEHVLASDANADANPLKDRPITAEHLHRLAERMAGIGDAVVKVMESNDAR